MNKALIVFVLFLCSSIGGAQSSDPAIGLKEHFIYYNLGALINVPSGFQVGYDRKVFNDVRWDTQGGVLLFSKNPTFSDFNATKKRGMRFQTGLKNYLGKHFYIGPQFLFKRVTMHEKVWLERYNYLFEQLIEVKRYRRTLAFALDIGWEYQYENNPWLLEISYAIGVQNLRVRYENYPEDAIIEELRGLGVSSGSVVLPFVNYTIKLKYPLGLNKKQILPESRNPKKSSRAKKSRRSKRRNI